jgi:hypothetical protein
MGGAVEEPANVEHRRTRRPPRKEFGLFIAASHRLRTVSRQRGYEDRTAQQWV